MKPLIFEEKHMDTRVTFSVYEDERRSDVDAMATRAFGHFAELENRFSLFRPDSEICRVNARSGRPVAVSKIFLTALKAAQQVAAESGGAFDPTVGQWTAPDCGSIAVQGVSFRDIVVDEAADTVFVPSGACLDLNAVVKGWAIDLALAEFDRVSAVMVEAGGDLRVSGLPPGKDIWDIGVRDPSRPTCLAAILPISAGAVCTSGDYFRGSSARASGRAHLVDGRDRHSRSTLTSLTVLAPTAREADVLSTAAFHFMPAAASAFVESHPNCSCLFITADGSVGASPRLAALLQEKKYASA